jgi:TniQ
LERDLVGGFRGHDWLSEETVYSWAARYHRLSGNRRAQTTARHLFGGRFCGFVADAPSGLPHFASISDSRLGTAEEILSKHTVLPYHLLFRPAAIRKQVIAAVLLGRSGAAKTTLGLHRVGSDCHVKACRICMDYDKEQAGVAYWHAAHQLPGVWFCTRHHVPLSYALPPPARYEWMLPHADRLREFRLAHNFCDDDRIARFSQVSSHALCKGLAFAPDLTLCMKTYRLKLRELRLLDSQQRCGAAAFDALTKFARAYSELPELEGYLRMGYGVSGVIRALNVGRRTIRSPIHMLLITWLFDGWVGFLSEMCNARRSNE